MCLLQNHRRVRNGRHHTDTGMTGMLLELQLAALQSIRIVNLQQVLSSSKGVLSVTTIQAVIKPYSSINSVCLTIYNGVAAIMQDQDYII